jgi:hypothetical protein
MAVGRGGGIAGAAHLGLLLANWGRNYKHGQPLIAREGREQSFMISAIRALLTATVQ